MSSTISLSTIWVTFFFGLFLNCNVLVLFFISAPSCAWDECDEQLDSLDELELELDEPDDPDESPFIYSSLEKKVTFEFFETFENFDIIDCFEFFEILEFLDYLEPDARSYLDAEFDLSALS